MNEISLTGYLRDIEFSHDIAGIEYEKANLICPGSNGKEDDIISLRYKKFCNKYSEGDLVELKGNLRSYSTRLPDRNTVDIYVFTYFDIPDLQYKNYVNIDGFICKKNDFLRTSKKGVPYLQFIIANNIFTRTNKKINSYLPCIVHGSLAEEINEKFNVKDYIRIEGELHSHEYKRFITKDEFEFDIAHELVVKSYEGKK